jgi:hypothetical protein
VVVSDSLRSFDGGLGGDGGATTAADGTFDVTVHIDTPTFAMALHRTGWSAPVAVPAGRADAAIEVPLSAPGDLSVHVRQGGVPCEASLLITRANFRLKLDTDARGEFELPRLAPGRYHIQASSLHQFGGYTSKPVEREVDVSTAAATDVQLDLPDGTLLVVTPHTNTQLDMIWYFLSPGTEVLPLAELTKRGRAGTVLGQGFGWRNGGDRAMEFHDLTPGTYTMCIDPSVAKDEHLPLVCRTVEVRADQPTVELDVTF